MTIPYHRAPTAIRTSSAFPIAAILAAIFFIRVTIAAPPTPAEDLWTFPEGTVAFVAFDPRTLGAGIDKDPTRALVEAGLRNLLDNLGNVEGGGSTLPARILTPGILGSSPYRVCLLEIAGGHADGPPAPDRPLRIERLAAIVEVRAPPNRHEEIIGAVRGSLDRDSAARRSAPGSEATLALPGGRAGTVFARAGEPEWREVSWSASPTGVLIGLGHGVLERWLNAPALPPAALPEWYAHRGLVAKSRGQSTPVLEAMIDASALRRSIPEEFASGRLGRILEAWHVPNARQVMLHVRAPRQPTVKPGELTPVPAAAPLLLVDLSYSSRADKPPACKSVPISQSVWPADLKPTPSASPYAIVLAANWPVWVPLALDTWVACSPRAGLEANAARGRWMRARTAALDRAMERSGPNIVVNGPAESIPTIMIPLTPGQPVDRTMADLREMFAPFSATIRLDAGAKMWNLRLPPEDADPDGLLTKFSWMVAKDGSTVLGAWSPEALLPAKPPK